MFKSTLPLRGRETAKRSGGVTRARQFRNNMTDAEWKMWFILRDMDWPEAHFRRQVRIGAYYADFLSHTIATHLSSVTPTPRLRRVPSPQGGGSDMGNSA